MGNGDSLQAFLRKRRDKDKVSERTLKSNSEVLNQFLKWIGDREINEQSINDYIEHIHKYTYEKKGKKCKYSKNTIYSIEVALKQFVAFLNPDFKDLISPKMPKNRKLPEELLTPEEIEGLINAGLSNRDRALISLLYESGMRKGELLSIKLKNIRFDDNGAIILIPESKTGSRRIRVVFSASFLRQWIDTHPLKDKPNAFLFCSLHEPYGGLSLTGLRLQLDTLARRAKIDKKIFPHLFRHSRATHLAKHLTEQEMKKYLGWTPNSNMAAVYVSLSGEDIDPAILRMNGIKLDDTHIDSLKVGRCPRCKELNSETSLFCGKCGMPLKDEVLRQQEAEIDNFEIEFGRLIAKYPKLLDKLSKI